MVAIALLAGAGTKRRTGETRRSGLRGGGVRIALLELKRSGPDAVRLRWRYRNESDQALNMELGAMGMDSYRFAKDVMLQDPVGNKYAVIDYNTPDIPAAKHDEFQFSVKLQPKQIMNTWAKLQSPPPEVKHVTVVMPGAPPFDNIPVQD